MFAMLFIGGTAGGIAALGLYIYGKTGHYPPCLEITRLS
jgi:hypothetical protein